MPEILVKQSDTGFQIELPADWLLANPLSSAALDDETPTWKRVGLAFRIKPQDLCVLQE